MPQQHFLDWSQPLLPALTQWLLEPATGPAAPDLSSLVLVVPTAESGRRLRASLAQASGTRGLLPPHIVTPEVLITWSLPPEASAAGRGELLAAWAAVLASLPLSEWRDLFPLDPVRQDAAWATHAAADILPRRRRPRSNCGCPRPRPSPPRGRPLAGPGPPRGPRHRPPPGRRLARPLRSTPRRCPSTNSPRGRRPGAPRRSARQHPPRPPCLGIH